MDWRHRKTQSTGSVLFRGAVPPRLEEFTDLGRQGVRVTPVEKSGHHWAARLSHPKWGEADVVCLRDPPRLPPALVKYDARLSEAERREALSGASPVVVQTEGSRGNILRDRKLMLYYLGALMGSDGVVAVDHAGHRLWSRGALNDELAHDAELDVDALLTFHGVTEERTAPAPGGEDDEPPPVRWLHSHGLAEIGFFDFDVLRPNPELLGRLYSALRGIAFAIVEGRVQRSTPHVSIFTPGGDVQFVDVDRFNRQAPADARALRGDDPEHNRDRTVLCDPAGKQGWVGRLLSRWVGGVRPSAALSTPPQDETVVMFSNAASNLQAERARGTYPHFRQLLAEFQALSVKPLVKLGYQVDGGGPDDREHLWFEVHDAAADRNDATLINEPFEIGGMKYGTRGMHDVERLSDWTIFTPAGAIDPRDTSAARRIRENPEAVRRYIEELAKAQ